MAPLLLAGPILRSVEPKLVTVWVALSAKATLEVRVWDGVIHDASNTPLFSTELPRLVPLSNTAATLRIGDHLHIAVVTFKLAAANALMPNRTYSYNVILRDESGAERDLKSLELLRTDRSTVNLISQWDMSLGSFRPSSCRRSN